MAGVVRVPPGRMNLRQRDRKYRGRESEAQGLQVARTKGAFVYDARGKRYIDFLSGWCVGNFGWDNTAITKSPARRHPDYVYPKYLDRPWVDLAQLLAQITPPQVCLDRAAITATRSACATISPILASGVIGGAIIGALAFIP